MSFKRQVRKMNKTLDNLVLRQVAKNQAPYVKGTERSHRLVKKILKQNTSSPK